MSARGVWELSTPRLEDLEEVLSRAGDAPCSVTQLQLAGFDGPAIAMLVGLPASHARAVVHAIVSERRQHPRPDLDLVWSGPDAPRAQSRDTSQVVRELFSSAERCVIVAGYAFWGASAIFETLHARALAVPLDLEFYVHVDPTGANRQMTLASFFRFTWPWTDVVPLVYTSDYPGGGHMHAKCVVVDERSTLITSANFTTAAQHENVELGVLVRDASFGARVAAQWRSLGSQGVFRHAARPGV